MANNLIDIIVDTFPADKDVGVPLLSQIKILFDREMDETSLDQNFFVEGPDTDQFVGPGLGFLEFPNNTSQGEINDFLRSPGYKGIVQGVTTFEKVDPVDPNVIVTAAPYRTRLIFTPDKPLAPLTDYSAILSDCKDLTGTLWTGIVTFSFQSGSGSIQAVPSSTSSSILKQAVYPATANEVLTITSTTPLDHSVNVPPSLDQIIVTFNQDIDPASVTPDKISVRTEPATDHPNAGVNSQGDIATQIQVSANKIIIKL